VNAEPLIDRVYIALTVAQFPDDGYRKPVEKTHELPVTNRIFPNPVGDNAQPPHAATDFCNEQQVGDEPCSGMNIDVGR